MRVAIILLLPLIVGESVPSRLDKLGKCAGEQQELQECKMPDCEVEGCVDCEWTDWSEWAPCGCDGIQDRHRLVQKTNTQCGKPCVGVRTETQECESECKLVKQDCMLSDWMEWGKCTTTCDGGQQIRTREITQELKNGGAICEGILKEVQACATESCLTPVDCAMAEWDEWSECSKTCNGGQAERRRSIAVPQSDAGQPCGGALSQTKACGEIACHEEVDCVWGYWTEWGACSETCGGGSSSRSRLISVAPRYKGKLCDPLDLSEVGACNTQPCGEVVDCEIAEWTEWHACSCSCNGIRARGRSIIKYPSNGGVPCQGAMKEIQSCNEHECDDERQGKKSDCKLQEWGTWGQCSSECGQGTRSRSRKVESAPSNGGSPCEGGGNTCLQEMGSCSGDCEGGEVGDDDNGDYNDNSDNGDNGDSGAGWGFLGGGENTTPAEGLEGTTTKRPVFPTENSDEEYAIDCIWSEWDEWGACTASCGGGQKSRSRQITTMASTFGQPCASQPSMEIQVCAAEECPCENCSWRDWSEWGACTCTGIEQRHRTMITHFNKCGAPCVGPKVMSRSCSPDCANKPTDCEFSNWAAWTACTTSCGGGTSERTRKIARLSDDDGKPCTGVTSETQPCNSEICNEPVDCIVGPWDEWTDCSASCGGGERFRERTIQQPATHGGKPCEGKLREVSGCSQEECGGVADCKWSQWSVFSACSTSCGGGFKTRSRGIEISPRNGGKLCSAMPKSEAVACNTQECKSLCKDAEWGEWSAYSLCSASCGTGYSFRNRCITSGGNACGRMIDGPMQEFQECSSQPCDDNSTDCVFTEWAEWSGCSCQCNGIQARSRSISIYANNGGKGCEGPLKVTQPCNVKKCSEYEVVDCLLSDWSNWGQCSAKCNGGSHFRERTVIKAPSNGGVTCDDYLQQVQPCNEATCENKQDCKWGEWGTWSACSVDCNGGQSSRYRHIYQMPKNNGDPCDKGASVEIKACNNQVCGRVEYCGWGQWAEWSACSVSCGDGEKSRQRVLEITTTKPEELLDVGVLDDMRIQLLELHGNFSTEHLAVVFIFGVLSSAIIVTSIFVFLRRRSTHAAYDSNRTSGPSVDLDDDRSMELQLLTNETRNEA